MTGAFGTDLAHLRQVVRDEGFMVTQASLAAVEQFFLRCTQDRDYGSALQALAPDLHVREHFLNVASGGSPANCSARTLVGMRRIRQEYPAFDAWLLEGLDEAGTPGCLVARWLAHLVGFRHQAIHVFLDHPSLPGYTFVQLRSFAKCGYPGCFDVPVGGHVVDTAGIDATLEEELRGELGLERARDLASLEYIADYEHVDGPERAEFRDVERRTLFRGRLNEHALGRCRFADQEVAALCLFSLHELDTLCATDPERVASGLLESYPYYRKRVRD
jgi:hypothetical protein